MLKLTTITKYQAFRWLCKFDPDFKWFWVMRYIKMHDLRKEVYVNLRDFKIGENKEIPQYYHCYFK